MKDKKCRKCRSVHAGKLIGMVCAEVVDEKPLVVNTGMYTVRYIDRTYRYAFEENVFICDPCLRVNRHRWCAGAILSFVVVMMSFVLSALSPARTIGDESFAIGALHIVGTFGGTFVLLLSLSRISGYVGRGLDNEVALPFLREDVGKHQTNAGGIALFTKADWEIIRQTGRARVEPDDDFQFALILLGTFVVPFAISFVLESIGVSTGLL